MKLILIIMLLFGFTGSIYADSTECKTEADTYGRHQTIANGLLQATLNGKVTHAMTDDVGQYQKKSKLHVEKGEYAKACEELDKAINKYNFKSIQQMYEEKHGKVSDTKSKTENKPPTPSSASSSVSGSGEASSSSAGGSAGGSMDTKSESSSSSDDYEY